LVPSDAGFGVAPNPSTTPASDVASAPLEAASAAQPILKRGLGAGAREYARCDLCGEPLGRNAGHFHMVSPLTARYVSVCRTCRRAALSEGYRPRA
jgi:hypothetical protein